ncbi:helix-turn-helix domain-containing protein [Defluviitalea raffinosedens]|uniref:Helix-turn-helix domain-containing protein n=1 Tax=Defluviitalea raffinosedens TaxID=1450156 RepID=A0A7C8HE70_9FIRM|nr:helix-turn-helix transcriptional regulator [Defluviitalea raffinosedens]KAE9633701.1 helix-turn-helix domain-containing protein [Defluviitalea raffinosedens]
MNLQKIRTEKGYSIAKLSELSGVPKRTIEDMERREREGNPEGKISTIIKLAEALEVTLDELCLPKK